MAEIKWIKINTTMFDDEKIKLIEDLPEGDSILIIWIKLLSQAGKCNAGGFVMLTENIPYTDEMLSTIFKRPLNVIRLALRTFNDLEMIEWSEDGAIEVVNWSKYQNIDALEKLKLQNAERQKRYRQKQLQIEEPKQSSGLPYKDIVNYLNEKAGKSFKSTSAKTQKSIKARWNEGYRLDDFKKVIETKVAEWTGGPMERYIRPETLFGTKFEGYLNQGDVIESPRQNNDSAFDDFLNGG